MSVRYQFSYWLEAKPINASADPDAFIAALTAESLVLPEGYLDVTEDPQTKSVSAEVDPKEGTVEEDTGLEEAIDRVAAKCPGYEITLRSNNEEDRAESSVTTWVAGKNMGTAYSRTIEPGELDGVTINIALERMAALLRKHGADWLVPLVQAEFEKKG